MGIPESTAPLTPLTGVELTRVARDWAHQRSLIVVGDHGSGRSDVVDEIVRRRGRTAEVRRSRSFADERDPYTVLLALRLVDSADAAVAPEALARTIAGTVPPLTLVLENAEYVDALSLRALMALVRVRDDVRLIAEMDRSIAALQSTELTARIPRVVLEPLDKAAIADVMERACGARPTATAVATMEIRSRGNFRSVLWLIELSKLHDGIRREHGAVRVLVPRPDQVEAVPDWSIEPSLHGNPAATALALAGGLTVAQLTRLDLVEACADLEAAGLTTVIDGLVRLPSPAIVKDVASRLGGVARHATLSAIVEALEAGEIAPLTAGALADWCRTTGVPLPLSYRAPAIRWFVYLGRHEEATELHAGTEIDDPRALADLALAYVATGCFDEAVAVAKAIAADERAATGAAWLAVVLGTLREGVDGGCAAAVGDFLARDDLATTTRGAVSAWYDLLVPGDHGSGEGAMPLGSGENSRRVNAAAAARALLKGRPVAAGSMLISPPSSFEFAVDRDVDRFLRFTTRLLAPDLPGAMDALMATREAGATDGLTTLLAAGHDVYAGNIADAWLDISRLIEEEGDRGAGLDSLAWAIASIASSMLGETSRAHAEYERALGRTTNSSITAAAALHIRGIAATQLNPSRHDDGVIAYRAAADAARRLRFPLLGMLATYRLAHELGEGRRSALLRGLAELNAADEPTDGVPGLFAEMASAMEKRDLRRLITVFQRLQGAGLIQDSKVLAMRLIRDAAAELPETTRRAVARLARFDFRRSEQGSTALTIREREVAALVAAGRTDREIGQALKCSPRTVGVHVSRILRKLGLPNRHALTADLADRHGAIGA